MAAAAMNSSRPAYTASVVVRLTAARPAVHAPSASPPMNAARTVLAAATVCPRDSVKRRTHAT